MKRRANSPSVAVGIDLDEQLGDGEGKHAVAEEFEPFVVVAAVALRAHAGMGQRASEQRTVLEFVAERLFERRRLEFFCGFLGCRRFAHDAGPPDIP